MAFRGENFGGVAGEEFGQKDSRGRSGKWKDTPREPSAISEPELVIPVDDGVSVGVEKPRPTSKYGAKKTGGSRSRNTKTSGVSAKSMQGTTTEDETIPDSVTVTASEIPQDVLEQASELLRGKPDKNWTKTPGPILKALRSAGFGVKVLSSGTPEKPGDMLELSQKHNSIDYTLGKRSTKEVAEILQGIIEQQERGRLIKAIEASSAQQSSKTSEPPAKVSETPIDSAEEGKSEVDALQNDPASVENVGDDDVPVLTDAVEEKIPLTTPETLSDEALRDRAEKIAIMRAEILRREEDEGQAEGTPDSVKTETEMPPVSVDTEKPREEALPVAPERPRTFDMRFASEFGVTKEMWEQIPGNEKLSVAQQKLVFKNLREFNERDKAPSLKHAWEGIMEKLGRKKDVGPTLDTLSRLVESVALYGPKVHEENGELLIDFVRMEIPRKHKKEWKQAFDSLNATAHRLSKTPASWQEDGIGTHSERESKMMAFMKNTFSPARKRYNEYQEIQKSYDAQKKELSRILGEAGYEPGVIAAKLVDIDKNVYLLQFEQTCPDAVEVIKNIPDAGMWKMIGKSLTNKSNLGYMALGAIGRTALAGAMGVFAAPTVSAAIAGGRAWDRTAAEMRERDRAARMGKKDTSGEALNIVSAEMAIDIAGKKHEVGATQKLQYLIDKYRALSKKEETLGETMDFQKEMSALVDSISVRASYVEDKQRLNRINFGNNEYHANQMVKLYEALATAKMIAADRKVSPMSAIEDRLRRKLSKTENTIQNKRRSRQVKEASWNALRAGSFSTAGVWLAHEAQEMGLGEKLKELLHTQNANELSPFDEPLLTTEEIARANRISANFPFAEDAPMNPNAANYPYAEDAPMNPNAANYPYAEDAPMATQHPPYSIRSGDTLTKILKEQMPEIKELGKGQAQENALANILRGLTPKEMDEIGLRSGNPNLIYAGDKIDMDALHRIIESRQSIIDSAVSRFGVPVNVVTEAPIQPSAPTGTLEGAPTLTTPVTGEVLSAEQYVARYDDGTYSSEDVQIRKTVFDEAQKSVREWTRQFPEMSSLEARNAGIVEGHFHKLFGEKGYLVYGTSVKDFLKNGPSVELPDSMRVMYEFNQLAKTVAQPPMHVVPKQGEGVEAFLKRASMAYALEAKNLPPHNLISKITAYYQPKGNWI